MKHLFLLALLSSKIVAHGGTGVTIQYRFQSNSSPGILRTEILRLNETGSRSKCSPKFWKTLRYHKKLVIKAL